MTIGAIDSSGNPFDSNNLGSVGIDWTDFENGFGVSSQNGLWYVLPSEEQGVARAFTGSDCQEQSGVLVARLTTFGADSEIQFQAWNWISESAPKVVNRATSTPLCS